MVKENCSKEFLVGKQNLIKTSTAQQSFEIIAEFNLICNLVEFSESDILQSQHAIDAAWLYNFIGYDHCVATTDSKIFYKMHFHSQKASDLITVKSRAFDCANKTTAVH